MTNLEKKLLAALWETTAKLESQCMRTELPASYKRQVKESFALIRGVDNEHKKTGYQG